MSSLQKDNSDLVATGTCGISYDTWAIPCQDSHYHDPHQSRKSTLGTSYNTKYTVLIKDE